MEVMAIEQLSELAPVSDRADPRLVADLHARRGRELWGLAVRLGLSEEQAADAVQETLLRLWAEVRREARVQSPDAWAFRTLYHLAMDQHRLRRRSDALFDRLRADPPRLGADPGASDERLAVWEEVDRLPLRQRAVLYLRYRADLPYEEIGDVLGMSASAARSHAAQAMATLRRRLGSAGGP